MQGEDASNTSQYFINRGLAQDISQCRQAGGDKGSPGFNHRPEKDKADVL